MTLVKTMNPASVKNCLISEEQAIAIYVMECWVLRLTHWGRARKSTLALCQSVLIEEKEHRLELGAYVSPDLHFKVQLWARIGKSNDMLTQASIENPLTPRAPHLPAQNLTDRISDE